VALPCTCRRVTGGLWAVREAASEAMTATGSREEGIEHRRTGTHISGHGRQL
jgi:hypothetical protein